MIYLVMTAHHPDGGSAGLMVAMFDTAAWSNLLQLPNVVRLHNALDMRLRVPLLFVDATKQDVIGLTGQDLIEAVAYGVPAEAGAAVVHGHPPRFEFLGRRSPSDPICFKGDVVLAAELTEAPLDGDDLVIVVTDRRHLNKAPAAPRSRYAH